MLLKNLSIVIILTALASCASIIGKSDYPVSIQSTPADINFVIKDEKGEIISQGKTPLVVTLKSSDSYFSKAHYTVEYTNIDGKTTSVGLEPTIDGWYFGNILFGGIIGMLIVDPLTGAMYSLPEEVKADFGNKPQLKVNTIDNLTKEQKDKLVPVK